MTNSHLVPLPWGEPPRARHSAQVQSSHAPVGKQHATRNASQFTVAHDVPSPCATPSNWAQIAGMYSPHSPLAKQQACVSTGQSVVAHAVPGPWGMPPFAVHTDGSITSMHWPDGKQHATTTGQY
jgi:hypothetical protein